MWIMPRGSSSVSRKSGMRETPASSNVFNSSEIGSFSSSAVMSARGIISDATRLAPKRKSRSSILRSASVKLVEASALNAPSRASRTLCGIAKPSLARRTCSQPWAPTTFVGRGSDAVLSCVWSVIHGSRARSLDCTGFQRAGVGICDTQFGKYRNFKGFHAFGIGGCDVIIAEEVQYAMNDKMLHMMLERDVLLLRPRA